MFVVVTGSAAVALKYCTPLVCLFLVSFNGFLSVVLAGRFHGTLGPRMVLRWHHVTALFGTPPRFGYHDAFAIGCAASSSRALEAGGVFGQVLGVSFCFC